jgi:hypothetical protein
MKSPVWSICMLASALAMFVSSIVHYDGLFGEEVDRNGGLIRLTLAILVCMWVDRCERP